MRPSRLCIPPLCFVVFVFQAPQLRAVDVDHYRNVVKPLLQEKCVPCHGTLLAEAGLRLDAGSLIHRGGDSGSTIDPQSPTESLLLERITADDSQRMPPEGEAERLSPAQIKVLRQWVGSGAVWPDDEVVPDRPEDHWAYQPIVRPVVPAGGRTNPIDALLDVKRGAAGIAAGPTASRELLVRRVFLDLVGLPPTIDQQDAFLSGSQSYDQLIDMLLSDPAYGQRWGRHWMDVWRYSDWDGYKDNLRGSQRHIWRWRDWIVESLNEDKPYDRMITEMLAGDEIAPADPRVWRATGFLARNFHTSNRDIWLDATVEHTSKAFLAMTLDCARCHDHKYDPLSQQAYYQMRAIFEPHRVRTERIPGQSDPKKAGQIRAYDADLDVLTHVYQAGDERRPDKENPVQPAVPGLFELPFEPQCVSLPSSAAVPDLQPFVQQEDVAKVVRKIRSATAAETESKTPLTSKKLEVARLELAALEARWKADFVKFADDGPSSSTLAIVVAQAVTSEHEWNIAQSEANLIEAKQSLAELAVDEESTEEDRSEKLKKAKSAVKTAAKTLAKVEQEKRTTYTPVVPEYPSRSSGRRSALASWITDPDNPLTARVAVNHVWLRHFGKPLVENVFDFGLRSPRPRHSDVLDWLAAELMDSEWRMKRLHRLIMTSAAYQMAPSVHHPDAVGHRQKDPDNALYWHASARRLEAEIVRDSVLHVAGNLDLRHGGAEIDFQDGETNPRRSLYFRHAYEKQMQMLVTFDAASPSDCYRRSPSVIPQQALALSNSLLAISQSRWLGAQWTDDCLANSQFIERAFRTLLARRPTSDEADACLRFLAQQTKLLKGSLNPIVGTATSPVPAAAEPEERARENLIHVLLNHNDFVTVR